MEYIDRYRGIGLRNRGKNDLAAQHLDIDVYLHPYDPEAYSHRGTNYGRLGEYQRAIEDYDKAIDMDPTVDAGRDQGQAHQRQCRRRAKGQGHSNLGLAEDTVATGSSSHLPHEPTWTDIAWAHVCP